MSHGALSLEHTGQYLLWDAALVVASVVRAEVGVLWPCVQLRPRGLT